MENERVKINEIIRKLVRAARLNYNYEGYFESANEVAQQKLDKKLKSMREKLVECHYIIGVCLKRGEAGPKNIATVKNRLTDVILDIGE